MNILAGFQQSVHFVPFGPYSEGALEALKKNGQLANMEIVTVLLVKWISQGREAAFAKFDMSWWLHISTAFGLIFENLQQSGQVKTEEEAEQHISMQSATPFVMTLPLKMSTIYSIAQWMRTPDDWKLSVAISADIAVAIQGDDADQAFKVIYNLFMLLKCTTMPFGFVHSSVEKSVALFVTGTNAQFPGGIYCMDPKDARDVRSHTQTSVIERIGIDLIQTQPWLKAHAAEFAQAQLFVTIVPSSKHVFVCWKQTPEFCAKSGSQAVNIFNWRRLGALVQPPSLFGDLYFVYTAIIVEGRSKHKAMTLHCREHSQLMQKLLFQNN